MSSLGAKSGTLPLWRQLQWRSGAQARSPLAARLLALIFAIYFGVALVVTAIQVVMQYGDELDKLQAEIDAAADLVLPSLSKALWNYDKGTTSAIVDGLARNRSLVGIRLEGDIPIVRGQTGSGAGDGAAVDTNPFTSRLYEQRYTIPSDADPGRAPGIATLHIYSSSGVVLSRAVKVFCAIVISAAIKTAALWLILYFTIRGVVARPLVRLACGLDKINQDYGADGTSARSTCRRYGPRRDELGFLLRAFVSMRSALRRSQARLAAHQRNLEATIETRTRELHHQATHDSLTGLLNRRAFESAMTSLVNPQMTSPFHGVLGLIDLDHFKLVNDTFGHAAGDRVLCQFADLLRRSTRQADTVARMGGDEFAVIFTQCSVADAQAKMARLEADVQSLIVEGNGKRVAIGLSAGLVAFSAQSRDHHVPMMQADAACYAAKEAGRHQVKVYDGEPSGSLRRKTDINWVNAINLAFSEGRFVLHAQPVFAAQGGRMCSVEVLVRMHMDEVLVLPGHFMPAAERFGLAARIDSWVVSNTLAFLGRHRDFLGSVECVHVNLSGITLSDPAFYRLVVRLLKQHGIEARKLCFEVTESAAILNFGDSIRIMQGLRRRGVMFAIDDFGSGMASFGYLESLPVDRVKIDGRFVTKMTANPLSRAIVESINDISHLAGKTTVAEWVENAEVMAELRRLKVDYLQGFHLGKPRPLAFFASSGATAAATDLPPHSIFGESA